MQSTWDLFDKMGSTAWQEKFRIRASTELRILVIQEDWLHRIARRSPGC